MDNRNLSTAELSKLRLSALAKGGNFLRELTTSLRLAAYDGASLKRYSGFTDAELADGGFRQYWTAEHYCKFGAPRPEFFVDRREVREWWYRDDRIPALSDRSMDEADREVGRYLAFGIPLAEVFIAYNQVNPFSPQLMLSGRKVRYFIDAWRLPLGVLARLLSGSEIRGAMITDFYKSSAVSELLGALTIRECAQAGIPWLDIYRCKNNLAELRKCGAPAEVFKELVDKQIMSVSELCAAGYAYTDLIKAGYDWAEIRKEGATAEDFKAAAANFLHMIPLYGKDRLFSWAELVAAYGLREMKAIFASRNYPFPFQELICAGFGMDKFREEGFQPYELFHYGHTTMDSLRQSGFTERELWKSFKKEGDWFLVREGLKPVTRLDRIVHALSA